MLRDVGGVNWCQSNQVNCLSLGVLSGVTLGATGLYYLANRKIYQQSTSTTTKQPLLHAIIAPKTVSAIRLLKYLSLQLVQFLMLLNNIVQVESLVWLTDNQMNYFFGSIYLLDTLFWTLCLTILYLDYNRLEKLSSISRFAWAIKFIDIGVQFTLIYVGFHSTTKDESLEYQLYMQLSNFMAIMFLNILSLFIKSFVQEQAKVIPIPEVNEEYVVKQYVTDTRPELIEQLCKEIKPYDEEEEEECNDQLETRTTTLATNVPTCEESFPPSSMMNESTISFVCNPTPTFANPLEQQEEQKVEKLEEKQDKIILTIDDFRIFEIDVVKVLNTKKFGKLTTVYVIVSKSTQGELKAQRSYREFKILYDHMCKQYPQESFPPMPQRKSNNELLDESDLERRRVSFSEIMKCFATKGLYPEIFRNFISQRARKSSSQSNEISNADSNERPDEMDEMIEEMMRNRFNQMAIKKVINQLKSGPSEAIHEDTCQNESGFDFRIREIIKKDGITTYRLETLFNGQTSASEMKRFNEFKRLHKSMTERYKVTVAFPEDARDKKEKLQQYMSMLCENENVRVDPEFKKFVGL